VERAVGWTILLAVVAGVVAIVGGFLWTVWSEAGWVALIAALLALTLGTLALLEGRRHRRV
jgi:drug/metabolite transporter superfamily protein YnfA